MDKELILMYSIYLSDELIAINRKQNVEVSLSEETLSSPNENFTKIQNGQIYDMTRSINEHLKR